MTDTSQGEGWWQANDGKWYPAESHPDYSPPPSPPSAPPPSPPLAADDVGGAKPPFWRRRWVLMTTGILIVIIVVAVLTDSGDKEGDTGTGDERQAAADEADEPADEPQAVTDEADEPADQADQPDDEADEPAAETSSTTTEGGTAPEKQARPFEEGCRYLGLDDFGDIQVELSFISPLASPTDLAVTLALSGGDGVRFLTTTAFEEVGLPEERFRIMQDTIEGLPANVRDEAAITCQILEIEDFGFGESPQPPSEEASCVFVELDIAEDIQVELTVTNPFAETADLGVTYALRGPDRIRFGSSTAFIEIVAPGEVIRVEYDTVTDLPGWVTQSEVTCEVLAIEDFAFG